MNTVGHLFGGKHKSMTQYAVFFVGGGNTNKFSPDDWSRLDEALKQFGPPFESVGSFVSDQKREDGPQPFSVVRTDKRKLSTQERNALVWYFRGVQAALDIKPLKD